MSMKIQEAIKFVKEALSGAFSKYPNAVESSHDDPYVLCVDVFAVPKDLIDTVESYIFELQQKLADTSDCYLLPMAHDLENTQEYYQEYMPVSAPVLESKSTKFLNQFLVSFIKDTDFDLEVCEKFNVADYQSFFTAHKTYSDLLLMDAKTSMTVHSQPRNQAWSLELLVQNGPIAANKEYADAA